MTESKGAKPRYKTTNWTAYNAALKARGSLTIWLDRDMQWYAIPSGKRGRQQVFSDAAIQFCLSIKCLFGVALRQSLGLVESLLRLAGLDWRVPDISTVSRRQKTLRVRLPYRPATHALDLLVDSTGIKFLGEGEWKRKKHGAEYRRQWRKVHLGIDARTLEVRAIEVTDNSVGDAPMLPELLSQIPLDEPIAADAGDGLVKHCAIGHCSDAETEYKLHDEAKKRHDSLSATDKQRSSPSGWYELLRFGRNLGRGAAATDKDPLPANAAHWRKIVTPAGEVWADLNAAGSYKFSDADFPAILGWDCIADDTATEDQRCDSAKLKALLLSEISDPAEKQRLLQNNDPMQMFAQVRKAGIAQKLRRAICKFPSEFDQGTFENRYGHIAREQYFQENPKNWDKLKAHIKALTFTDLPEAYKAAQWHFEPVEFTKQMRRCMWLSKSELKQMVPIRIIRHQKHRPNRSSPLENRYHWESVDFTRASALIDAQCVPLNRMMRKFGITTPKRQASFLGNAIQETTWFSTLQERGATDYWYAPWFGRGFLQLTHAENYIEYWRWIGRSAPESLKAALKNAAAQAHSANSNAGLQDSHFPALTQEMRDWRKHVSDSDVADAADSAGFYWSMKKANESADGSHALERQTVTQYAPPHATLSYYRSVSFWKTCAIVNLPGAVNTPWSMSLNGFVDRCCAYAQVLMVVSEMQFPTASGLSLLPETLTQRRV